VVATDIAPTMVERLKARAVEEGLSNLDGHVMDGEALEFEDDSFDVSASLNGVSLFPNIERGLRDLVRVTKSGGRVVIAAFGAPTKAEFIGFFVRALQAAVPGSAGLPMEPPPLPFQVADPNVMRRRLGEAGLTEVEVETTTWPMEFRSATHLWNMFTSSNPIGASLVADLTPEQKADVMQVLDGMLGARSRGGRTAVLQSEVNIGTGST
jgi:SAM-dependent methyltransferase